MSSCSFGVYGLIGKSPGGGRVRSWSMGTLGFALEVVRVVRCRWVHWGAPSGSWGLIGVDHLGCALGVVRCVGGCWIHWGAPWVLSGSLGSLGCVIGTSGSFGIAAFIELRPRGHRVRSGSLCSLW